MRGQARRQWRVRHLLGTVSVAAALLGSAGNARATSLTCFQNSGNPFLIGFANGIAPGGAGACIQNFGNSDLTVQANVGAQFPVLTWAGYVQVTAGNIIVPQGDTVTSSLGIGAAPAAVQAQIAAFNLAHGIPAAFQDPFSGVEVTQSSLSGQVVNNGTITAALIAPGLPQFAGLFLPSIEGIWVSATTFTGSSAGIVNNGSITVRPGIFGPFNSGGFGGPFTTTAIRLDAIAGNFGTILNSNTGIVTALSGFTPASATPSGAVGIELTAPAAGAGIASGTTVNAGTLSAQATGNFPQAFAIQIGGATTGVGGTAPGPNGGTLQGDIVNSGSLSATVSGALNGNGGGAAGIRLNLATTGTGGSPGIFNGNIFNSGTLSVSADGAGLFAHGIEVGASTINTGALTGGIFNSGTLTATGTNGATGVGISVISPVSGGITNSGTLSGSTAAIDLTKEVSGSTSITQAAGIISGNILGSGRDALSITGGSLVLAPTGVANGLASFMTGPGGTLALQLTPTQAPLITVNGVTTLSGGTVQVQPQPGNYALQTSYTILTASGGVTGRFADATTTSAFLAPTLTYDANDVFLTLSKTGIFSTQATTPNQRSVAAALDASPFNSALVLAALSQSATTAGSTFDALSGEIHGSVQTTMLDDSVFVREALLGRLRQASFAGEPGPLGALGYAGPRLAYGQAGDAYAADLGFPVKAAPAGTALTPDWTWWTQAIGSWGQIDGNGNAGGVRRDLGGAFTGVDRRFGDNWRAGVASGYSYSSVSDNARLSSAHIDTAYAAAYAGANYGAFSFRSGATGAWNMVNTGRSIVFPGFVDAATARYDAATAQVFGEAAYAKALGNLAVEPFAGLAWVHLATGSFAEVGGVAALGGARKDDDVGYSSLGVRFATSFALANGMMLIPRAAATWEHAFGDVNPVAALTFLSTAASFTAGGVPLAGDTAIIDAGFDVRINPHARIGLSYFGQLASGAQDHAVKGNFTWNF